MVEREKLVSMVTDVQNGKNCAVTELYETFQSDIYYFIFKTVNNDRELAEDLTQDTFIEILETIHKLEEPAAFVTWSKQIAYHKCTAYFRKRKDLLVDENEDGHSVFDTLEEDREEFIPDAALNHEDLKETIMNMIKELPEEQRSAIVLRYFNEISVKDIAEIQGVSEGTVKSRLNYGRKAIKQSVEEYEKKNDVRLHCAGVLPLLLWFFRQYRLANGISLSSNTATTMFTIGEEAISAGATTAASSAAAATSGSATASATTAGTVAATATSVSSTAAAAASVAASTGAKALIAKIVAGVLAATVGVGGVVAGITNIDRNVDAYVDPEICDHNWRCVASDTNADGTTTYEKLLCGFCGSIQEWGHKHIWSEEAQDKWCQIGWIWGKRHCIECGEEVYQRVERNLCEHEWVYNTYETSDGVVEEKECVHCSAYQTLLDRCMHEWSYYEFWENDVLYEDRTCEICKAYEITEGYFDEDVEYDDCVHEIDHSKEVYYDEDGSEVGYCKHCGCIIG